MITLLFQFLLLAAPALAAEEIKADHVKVSWIAPETFGQTPESVGIQFELDPHWHVYWKNPGDSGAAPKFNFSSDHFTFGKISWPYPKRIPFGSLVNIGYEERVVFPVSMAPTNKTGTGTLKVKLEWLVCKEECIPGRGELTLTRPIAKAAKWRPTEQSLIREALEKIPALEAPLESALAYVSDDALELKLAYAGAPVQDGLELFPIDPSFLTPQKPDVAVSGNTLTARFSRMSGFSAPERTDFLVVSRSGAFELQNVPLSTAPKPVLETGSLFGLVLSAFVGGILLNLMPCVFPVLFLKIFGLMKSTGESRGKQITDALMYAAGVLATFALLGGVLVLLRSAGQSLGWGFQLQYPPVVFAMIVLFWLMGLNFAGVFEFGNFVANLVGRGGLGKHSESSFFTGVLAVFVAAPCTGPFMGTALGAAATLPALPSLIIFLSLGLGLAFPFLFFSFFPSLATALPRPGRWMEIVKEFFAFPLFATVLWLLWVLGVQTGVDGIVSASLALFTISFALWLGKRANSSVIVILAWILAIGAIAYTGVRLPSPSALAANGRDAAESMWAAYDKTLITEARKKGQPVFIDFTAAWCITCQLNKKVVLDTTAALAVFQKHDTLLVRADWTSQNPEITAALAEQGRNSVPLYLFYRPGATTPVVLPQILTLAIIEDLFSQFGLEPTKETK